MSQFGGPMFETAQQQFHVIADHLEIRDDERNRLIPFDGVSNRTAAMAIGVERVLESKRAPGLFS
jgi:hypothetical protein